VLVVANEDTSDDPTPLEVDGREVVLEFDAREVVASEFLGRVNLNFLAYFINK
jgi:hypothetical protein